MNTVKGRELWLKEENQAIESFFKKDIILGLVPNKSDCDRCLEKHPELSNRSWVQIKSKVHNIISKDKKKRLRQ